MQSTTKLAFVTATATAGSLASSAGAAILSADFSAAPLSISTSPGSSIFIDFDTVGASINDIPNFDAKLLFQYESAEKPRVLTGQGQYWRISSDSFADKLAFGDTIPEGDQTSAYLENYGGTWNNSNDGHGYLGFYNSVTGAQAWAEIDYNDNAGSIQLLGLGYNPDGAMFAGETSAIPEPASAVALAALLAGGAAAFKRRRR